MGKTDKTAVLPIETKPCHLKGLLFLLVLPEKNHGDCPAVSMLIYNQQIQSLSLKGKKGDNRCIPALVEDLALFQPALFDFKLFDLEHFHCIILMGGFFTTLHTIWVINAKIYWVDIPAIWWRI